MRHRKFISATLAVIMILLVFPLQAFADLRAFTPDDEETLNSFKSTYNWDSELINAAEWTGENGEEFERIISQQREFYDDLAQYSEDFCIENGIIQKDVYSSAGGSSGNALAKKALEELNADDNYESPPNTQNVKYNTWYYGHPVYDSTEQGYAWCAVFVCYCADQCGLLDDIIPRTAGVGPMFDYFVDNQGCEAHYVGDGYEPQPGDIWIRSDKGHVGIVVGNSGGMPQVVHGNTPVGGTDGVGYGTMTSGYVIHPAYPAMTMFHGEAGNGRGIFEYLINNGYQEAQSVAIVANLDVETGGTFSPGAYNPWDVDGESVGMCQWHAGRITTLKSWCSANGLDWTTTEGQLAYMLEEANPSSPYNAWTAGRSQGYSGFINAPNDQSGAGQATFCWAADWERCADPWSRISYGESWWRELVGK